MLVVRGSVAQIEKTFNVEMRTYRVSGGKPHFLFAGP